MENATKPRGARRMPTLYSSARSSASWRVRIALAWKRLPVQMAYVNLRRDGGEQHTAAFRARNPHGLVPFLDDSGTVITQSVAICEYLEECHPLPPLLPPDPQARAQVRALVHAIACDIHPLNNLRVLRYLARELGHAQQATDAWYRHWIETGFAPLEEQLAQRASGRYCCGDAVSLADVFLAPQVLNARRFEVDLAPYPRIVQIDAALNALPAFADTAPARQADYS
jgi:maleylacetoacetate isomerase